MLGAGPSPSTAPAIGDTVGFYDPRSGGVVVLTHPSLPHPRGGLALYDQDVLAYEDAYALADQAFGHSPPRRALPNQDADLAAQTLRDGDAVETRLLRDGRSLDATEQALLTAQIRRVGGTRPAPSWTAGPYADPASFPYVEGQIYVNNIVLPSGSFAAIDRQERAGGPCSTRYVAEPPAFPADDGCVDLPVPAAAILRGWHLLETDVMGALRGEGIFDTPAAPGFLAGTWRADRYAVYGRGAARLLLWHLHYQLGGMDSRLASYANHALGASFNTLTVGNGTCSPVFSPTHRGRAGVMRTMTEFYFGLAEGTAAVALLGAALTAIEPGCAPQPPGAVPAALHCPPTTVPGATLACSVDPAAVRYWDAFEVQWDMQLIMGGGGAPDPANVGIVVPFAAPPGRHTIRIFRERDYYGTSTRDPRPAAQTTILVQRPA